MNRALLAMAFCLVAMAALRAAPVLLGVSGVPLTPAAVVVAWAALALAPLEAVVTASPRLFTARHS